MVQVKDESFVFIPGALSSEISDLEAGEILRQERFSWRSYYPGFPASHSSLILGWNSRMVGYDETETAIEVCDTRPAKLSNLNTGFRAFETHFRDSKEAELAEFDRKRAGAVNEEDFQEFSAAKIVPRIYILLRRILSLQTKSDSSI